MFTQDFPRHLLDHLLARIQGLPFSGDEHDFTDSDRDAIVIDHNRIYEHKTIRFMSMTYDAQRLEESANPRTHPDIMVLSHEDDKSAFPYWHARIIGIYHFMVRQRILGRQNSRPLPEWTSFLFGGLVWTLMMGRVVGGQSECIR